MSLKKANQHYKFTKFILSELFSGLIIGNYLKNQKEPTLTLNHHKAHSSKHQLSFLRQRNHDIFIPIFFF